MLVTKCRKPFEKAAYCDSNSMTFKKDKILKPVKKVNSLARCWGQGEGINRQSTEDIWSCEILYVTIMGSFTRYHELIETHQIYPSNTWNEP